MTGSSRSDSLPGAPAVALLAGVLLAGALMPCGVDAADGAAEKPQPIVYQPPDLGAPPTRTLAAARGQGDRSAIQVLAPEQTGLVLEPQPKLLWYLPESSATPIEIALIDEQAIEPLLELELGPVPEAGVHAVDLKEHGVQLEPGVEYRWSVAQVVDPEQRSADAVASATIALQRPDQTLLAELADAPPVGKLRALAGHGYWYDVLALLSEEIAARPDQVDLRQLRAGLLDQAGLDEVAAYDREAAGLQ